MTGAWEQSRWLFTSTICELCIVCRSTPAAVLIPAADGGVARCIELCIACKSTLVDCCCIGLCIACRSTLVDYCCIELWIACRSTPVDCLIPAADGGVAQTPPKTDGTPSMLAYLNPAFNPSFISRIPKPAPLQAPLQELSSTSQMQPAQHHHALYAVHALPAASQTFKDGPSSGGQPDCRPGGSSLLGMSDAQPPCSDPQALSHPQQLTVPSDHVFSQPGHAVASVVCTEDAQQPDQFVIDQTSSLHAWTDQQLGLHADAESDTDFGVTCQRLVAIIEVQSLASLCPALCVSPWLVCCAALTRPA